MAKTVDEAFSQFVGWLAPTAADRSDAASHRGSIEQCIKNAFGASSYLLQSGSYGHGTSITKRSDADYFAVVPASQLTTGSNYSLQKFRGVLQERFPSTTVTVRSPAVVLPFGSGSQTNEIIPAYFIKDEGGHRIFGIPNRNDGWMSASPHAHAAYVNAENTRLGSGVKPLIQLMKAWKYYREVPLRSFYLELRTTEYAKQESSIIHRIDVKRVLGHLQAKSLAAMQDPMGVSGYVYAGTDAQKEMATSRLDTAYTRAVSALEAEQKGKIAEAFYHWDQLFGGQFPSYS